MAQLIVERSSIVAAILPSPDQDVPGALSTLNALMLVFCSYLQKVVDKWSALNMFNLF
jgi:hypothetical protein